MGDGVLDSTSVFLDVDLLATGDDNAHAEGAVAAGEGGGVAGRAGAELLDVLGAVGGGGLVEPDGLAGGLDGEVVDGRGGAGRGEAEVLGRGAGEEAGEGDDGGGGLHFEWWIGVGFGLVWLCWLIGLSEGFVGWGEGSNVLIPSSTWLLLVLGFLSVDEEGTSSYPALCAMVIAQ